MTNWEKFKDEIIKMNIHAIAKSKNGELGRCGVILCRDCEFNSEEGCLFNMAKWLDEEYKEVRDVCSNCRHFNSLVDNDDTGFGFCSNLYNLYVDEIMSLEESDNNNIVLACLKFNDSETCEAYAER